MVAENKGRLQTGLLLLLLLLLFGAADAAPRAAELEAALRPVLSALSARYNTSLSLGVQVGADTTLALAAGVADRATGEPMTTEKLIPLGSATKMYTATLLMHLAETDPSFDLDRPVHQIVDPWLLRTNGTTLLKLWNENVTILEVTARHLIGMRAGFGDYNDSALKAFTIAPATRAVDVTPYDFLHELDKTFLFRPGNGTSYSSTGMMLAGMTYAAHIGVDNYTSVDQLAFAAPPLRESLGGGVDFMGPGLCSSHDGVSHQYTTTQSTSASPYWMTTSFVDLFDTSCLNGWTCGNIAARPSALVRLVHHLFSPSVPSDKRLVKNESLAAMMDWHPFSAGFAVGYDYGLGLMKYDLGEMAPHSGVAAKWTTLVGHSGQDYGSGAPLHHYNAQLDMSVVLAMNTDAGMNCSALQEAQNAENDAICLVYATALKVLTNGTIVLPCEPPKSTLLTQSWRQTQLGQTHQHGVAQTAVVGGSAVAAVGMICDGEQVCGGASSSLKPSDCIAWKDLWVTTNGEVWSVCPDSFNDPCSCAGHVACSVVNGDSSGTAGIAELRITGLNLANATLIGFLPPEMAALDALTSLELSGNLGLSGSDLPSLPFASYKDGCALDGIAFDCPLPTGVEVCHAAKVPALKSGKSGQCLQGPPISLPCELDFYKVLMSTDFERRQQQWSADLQHFFQGAMLQDCVQRAMTTKSLSCNVSWDWSPYEKDIVETQAAASAALPGTAVELCSNDGVLVLPFPIAPGADLRIFVSHMLWTPVPATCTREDRESLLSFYTQNKTANSPFHFVTWNSVECLTGRPKQRGGEAAPSRPSLVPPIRVEPQQLAAGPQRTLAVGTGGINNLPPVSELCLAQTFGLLGNPTTNRSLGNLQTAFGEQVLLPLLKKCELGLLLSGKCKADASLGGLTGQFAATTKALAAVVPGTKLCVLDGISTMVNSDVTSKHSLLSLNITKRTFWPVPQSCTTGDRQRLREWLGANAGAGCGFGAVECFLTFSDDECGIQQRATV